MCGIFAAIGEVDYQGRELPEMEGHVRKLDHRGPDKHGIQMVELPWTKVYLGMTRLKVVDQTDIPVPYDFRDNLGVVLAFNGEVFNWKDLRVELNGYVEKGWKTQCDAEVVAAAWRAWGPECLEAFNGMWGFVLVDTLKNEVFIARDRAGEKPVYLDTRGPDVTYVASEIKALPLEKEACYCADVAALEFDCGQATPFVGIEALLPGHYEHYSDRWCYTKRGSRRRSIVGGSRQCHRAGGVRLRSAVLCRLPGRDRQPLRREARSEG
jgi:asparagine synthase (glutamine-hydrolysing)